MCFGTHQLNINYVNVINMYVKLVVYDSRLFFNQPNLPLYCVRARALDFER